MKEVVKPYQKENVKPCQEEDTKEARMRVHMEDYMKWLNMEEVGEWEDTMGLKDLQVFQQEVLKHQVSRHYCMYWKENPVMVGTESWQGSENLKIVQVVLVGKTLQDFLAFSQCLFHLE